MRLTTKTDYCLRVLIYLQTNHGITKIQKIADFYNISKNHLSVAVNKLSELGYVTSLPGPNGGISFNESVANKTIADLVTQLEEFEIAECFNLETNTCRLSPQCKLKSILRNASKSFIEELRNHKISELGKI